MFSAKELFSYRFADMASIMVFVSMLSMALTLLGYTVFMKQIRPFFKTVSDRRRVRLMAGIATSAGIAVVGVGATFGNVAVCTVCNIVGGLASGVGSAALLMSYGVSFSVCDTAAAAMQFALSCVVTCMAYALVMVANAYVHPFGVVLCAATPLLELACLNISSKQLVDRTEFTSTTMPINVPRFAVRVAPSALAFGFLFGFLGMHAFKGVTDLALDISSFVGNVVATGVLTCVLLVVVMLTMRQRANYAFRTLNSVIALVVSLVTYLIASGITTVVHCLFLVAYMLVEACLWISYTDMSQKFRISPFRVYGTGRGLVALGAVAATALMLPESPFYAQLNSIEAILPVALVLLVFGSSAYPRDSEIVDVLLRGTCCPAFFDPFDPNNESLKVMAEAQVEALDASDGPADGQAAVVGKEAQPISASDELPVGRAADGAACEAAMVGEVVKAQGIAAAAQSAAEPSAPSPADGAVEGEQDDARIGRYKRRCLALANMCLLSRRETEVLFLLAKGYNTKMIQEQLFISAGTANTHMRHVYRKLDVHSQQDLIRMVDSIEVEDEDW